MFKLRSLIGSYGMAQTTLCPSGYIKINGQRFEAVIRDSPKVEQGKIVQVIDTVCFSLVVKVLIDRSKN